MKCPKCLSTNLTILDQWIRQCRHCGHRFPVTRHTERQPQSAPIRKEQP